MEKKGRFGFYLLSTKEKRKDQRQAKNKSVNNSQIAPALSAFLSILLLTKGETQNVLFSPFPWRTLLFQVKKSKKIIIIKYNLLNGIIYQTVYSIKWTALFSNSVDMLQFIYIVGTDLHWFEMFYMYLHIWLL